MSDEEELDLRALQRQLDDAFQTTRPRPAFEDELWLRMQARRPIWQRLRDGFAGLFEGMREAPGVPATAVAILLVVVIGAAAVKLGGLSDRASSTAGLATGQDGGVKNGGRAEYGPLPVPAFTVENPTRPTDHGVAGPTYYNGSATLVWAGQLDVTASSLPVFRYREPTASDAEQFGAALGAGPAAQQTAGSLGTYAGDNFVLEVTGSVGRPAKEPSFILSELNAKTAAGSDPVRVATAYLAARSLIPAWSYQTEVAKSGGTTRVRFIRLFDTPNEGQIPLVDPQGNRYGIEVDIRSGQPSVVETGPLPLAIDSATYPIIASDQAVRTVLATSANPAAGIPVVKLTKAELVYVLVWAGDHSFYEPAYLFSGTFSDQGVTKIERVLVPAIDPSFLSP